MPAAKLVTAPQLRVFAMRCDALAMAPALDRAMAEYGITTPARICHFLGQIHHESVGLSRLEEDLNYTAKRLTEVWPKRFPTIAAAAPYARNPRKLAEKTYGGRLGNTAPGDGWKYRGGGLIMNTGRDNYERPGELIGVDLVAQPELLRTPPIAALAAAAWWQDHGCNELADREDVTAITRRVQGGSLGLEDRKRQVARANAIWRPGWRA